VGDPKVIQLPSGAPVAEITTADDQHLTFSIPQPNGTANIGKRVMWRELLQ